MRDIPADRFPPLTRDLPGAPARVRATPEDFEVHELPLYEPSGSGEHVLFEIEKRGHTTHHAAHLIGTALGVPPARVGYAGLKDRDAVTRQWLCVTDIDPAEVLRVEADGLRVLRADRHTNRLRQGHLRGNRFTLTLRDVPEGGAARYRAIAQRLVATGVGAAPASGPGPTRVASSPAHGLPCTGHAGASSRFRPDPGRA